jgi:hypothetical protein
LSVESLAQVEHVPVDDELVAALEDSINGVGPLAPSSETGATSVIGSRRRAAAIASPSRVCAFSRTSSSLRA